MKNKIGRSVLKTQTFTQRRPKREFDYHVVLTDEGEIYKSHGEQWIEYRWGSVKDPQNIKWLQKFLKNNANRVYKEETYLWYSSEIAYVLDEKANTLFKSLVKLGDKKLRLFTTNISPTVNLKELRTLFNAFKRVT